MSALPLYDHALRLMHASPDGLPPRRGFTLSRTPDAGPPPPALSREDAAAAVRSALDPLPSDPATLHRRFAELGVRDRHRTLVRRVVAELPLPDERRDAARSLARRLARTGTAVPPVIAALALLARVGDAEDVPCLTALSALREVRGPAVQALEAIDPRRAAVLMLGHDDRPELRPLVGALWRDDHADVLAQLEALPMAAEFIGGATARRIAQATRLLDLLHRHPTRTALLGRAGRLLVRMVSSQDGSTEFLARRDVPALYETVVARAGLLPPALDHHATLLSLALDLSSGTAVLLDWPDGRRAALLESLGHLLAEPRWAAAADTGTDEPEGRVRARWIRRTGRRPFLPPAAPGRLRIEVVAGDPVDREPMETRVLVDGRPLVPAVFPHGPAHRPEFLLENGSLRAGPEPHDVQLAEAACTEGCCGALTVTIRRDGDQVVWENWRRPPLPGWGRSTPSLPAERFDAAAYDAEVARAEADRSWSWPALELARLIREGLTARPEPLRRWDMTRGWISTAPQDPDTVEVHLWYTPGLGSGAPDGHPLVLRWSVPDDGTSPGSQAGAALRRLAEEDPRGYTQVSAGTRERAEELGFTWPYGS
ncbi:hypothetical protein JCM4814A_64480 [Streptomyces phaeofaciens JCM 4814]|uniref:Uncharacterized protein n=1 Tax=Streptomyces phaeofaciens TaxID=68254 RepID=A0A918HLA0_9ACTN|nr:hypothetical protein [Streptomyces phaeofaciens]GGT76586.1 hypothetical protein GCM10010226_63450 [Streptomyces phaeofaciens]